MLPNDISGQRFGRLVAKKYLGAVQGNSRWLCRCDCGASTKVLANSLRRGLTASCGCLRRERSAQHRRKHGATAGYNRSQEYVAYQNAKSRCTNPRNRFWNRYGGRGIRFRFRSFKAFAAALGPKPGDGRAWNLDRIDNDGNYEAGNVRWVTHKQNCNNKSWPLKSPAQANKHHSNPRNQ
jgi:hypothetical protein